MCAVRKMVGVLLIADHPVRTPKDKKMAKYTNQTASQRREQFLTSWREHAPDVTFGEKSLAQFEAETAGAIEVRQRIQTANTQLAGLIAERNAADRAMNDLMILVAHAIRGNPAYGENSALYRSLGYVPKSERRSGLSRKAANPANAGTAEDAGTV